MAERRFNPLDPLGLFERMSAPKEPLPGRIQARQEDVNKFLASVRKQIPDETMAQEEYRKMSIEAERLGFTAAARTLMQISQDEGRHKLALQDINITVW